MIKDVRGKLTVTNLGTNTVKITYSGNDPVLCQQVVQGTIDQFRSWDLTARVEQSAIEREFYQKQLQIYQNQVDAAAKRVEDFQRATLTPTRPRRSTWNFKGCSVTSSPHCALLSATSTKIEQANAANSLSDSSRQYEFQILDAPTVPTRPAATATRLAEYIALGLVASFGFIFFAVAFATWQDTTVRNGDDLQRLTRVPLLDEIPHLRFEPGRRRQAPATRRSLSLHAGSRRPIPRNLRRSTQAA